MNGHACIVGGADSTLGMSVLSMNTLQEGTQYDISFECHIIDANELKNHFVPKIYMRLGINKFIKTMSSQRNGTIKKPVIIFYNQFQKEIVVKHKDIRDLKNLKTRLGNVVMDFVFSRVYLIYPEYYRHEIHIVRSYISGSAMGVMKSGSGLRKLAKDFL